MNAEQRLHEICSHIRCDTWAGIDESRAECRKCPAKESSPYGPGTRGCRLLAQTVYNIAVFGNERGKERAREKQTEQVSGES